MTGSLELKPARYQVLALHGGRPVREALLPYGHHHLEEPDIQAVMDVLRSEWLTTGPKLAEFEAAFATFVGARDAVALSSGTAALHAAAFAAGLGPGDEAITTPLTFCATANCVVYQGARPVFADVCEETLNIDPHDVARRISPCTKAILPVDYAGHPADLDALMRLAETHGLVVIEDATHAPGAWCEGRRVGSISHMTVFSFHPVKHLTTGEGGMVTTDHSEFARRLRMFRHHGIDQRPHLRAHHEPWYYEMTELGYNYRLSDIGCALGLSQLKRLDANLARRTAIASRYTEAFRGMRGLRVPTVRPGVRHAWHLYPLRLELECLSADRAEILRALRAEGLGATVHFIPVHRHPYYRSRFGYQDGDYPLAEEAYTRLVSLPLFSGMSDQDVQDVIQATTKVMRCYARS